MGYFTIGGGVLKWDTSSPVKIATTPGAASASRVLIPFKTACARSDLKNEA
jgi:hypothetical protein